MGSNFDGVPRRGIRVPGVPRRIADGKLVEPPRLPRRRKAVALAHGPGDTQPSAYRDDGGGPPAWGP